MSPRCAVLGVLAASIPTLLFSLSWLDIAVVFQTQATPPVNSASLLLSGAALYLARRPFSRPHLAVLLGCGAFLLGLVKPALGLSGLMQSVWVITNTTLICLLAISVILLSLQRPVAAQLTAFAVLVLLSLSALGLLSSGGAITAISIMYVSGLLVAAGVLMRTAHRGPVRRMLASGASGGIALAQAAVLALALMGVTFVTVQSAIDATVVPLITAAILLLTWLVLVKLMPFLSKATDARAMTPSQLRMVKELDEALEADEFTVFFQPQMELATGRIVGAEALVRWRRPDQGMVPPASFIPIAEESGRIIEIGYRVLQMACTEALLWQHEMDPAARLSVNISPVQLQAPDLLENVVRILDETGFAPNRLVLELTETALIRRGEPGFDTIWALHDLGISIAIDDFGTGYSCLAYLSDLPVQYLKIDQSFVRKLHLDGASATICRSIVGLGHGLGQTIIAEGIETVDQEAFLKKVKCEKGQGYYYARPMSSEAFALWAHNRNIDQVRNLSNVDRKVI